MELSQSSSALGLYKYNCNQPENDLFDRFYSTMVTQLESCHAAPTYVGAEGNGYSGKLTKIGSRTHNKLVQSRFADVSVLSIAANPLGSDEPAYDSFASASVSYVKENRELLACIVINESFVKLFSGPFDNLLHSLVGLYRWDFGYGFSSSVEKQPDFHILGLDNGSLSPEEYRSLATWYAAPGEIRTKVLRNVYPYNIVNETQLEANVSKDMTLRQFAQQNPGTSLTRLADYGLYVWQVSDAEVVRLRGLLIGSPVLMS